MKKNSPGFLPVVKCILTVTTLTIIRQHYTLQSFGILLPFRHDVDERQHVTLGDDMTESSPW